MIETDIISLETHLNTAQDLYLQRENCMEQKHVESYVQQSIEKRLLVHLHVLSHNLDNEDVKPKDDTELFVYLSRKLLSPNEEHNKAVLVFSKNIFIEHSYPKGLVDAFILFYNQDINNLLKELFENNKKLRATIITIWHLCDQKIPLALLNQSELQHLDHELQCSVLTYHAEQENIGLELFQNYYRSLIENVQKEKLSSSVLHAALWGGMLRQDDNVLIAIRRAIELESDNEQREKYLRLAALDGNSDFLPIFNSVCESKPEFGSYLISLLGTTESITILFSMLQNPKISLLIIPAWLFVTGQQLKSVPRIALVENNSTIQAEADDSDDVPLIADVKSAQMWAKKNVTQWHKNTRYIYGKICNPDNLIRLGYRFSGEIGKDVFDLLSLNNQGGLKLKIDNWVLDRYEVLDKISNNKSMSNG